MKQLFPPAKTIETKMTLHVKDAAFLKRHLPMLPDQKKPSHPILLICDWDGSVSVQASTRGCDDAITVLLPRSSYKGKPYFVLMYRKHMEMILKEGFRIFHFGTGYPMAVSETSRFVWCPEDCGSDPLESQRPSLHKTVYNPLTTDSK